MDKIIILDFGSQYTQLIARRIRSCHVYCEILPFNQKINGDKELKGIILSGGPNSIYDKKAYKISPNVFNINVPILGICYGMQLIASFFKGKVTAGTNKEYGKTKIKILDNKDLFRNINQEINVWMSHGDQVSELPPRFSILAKSENNLIASISNIEKKIWALQFHPEVHHTSFGSEIIKNFLFEICKATPAWTMENFINCEIESIRQRVKSDSVICGLSGGVDSTVTALILHRAIGNQLTSIFVDNGLVRDRDIDDIRKISQNKGLRVKIVNAKKIFVNALKGIKDPERKRKIIGREFARIFEIEAKKVKEAKFLAQGTLYPDRIESLSQKGPSSTIKSHHNVGGLPKNFKLNLVEPLKELFKDEVRLLGKELDLSDDLLFKHPFPGPGFAVRIIGEVTPKSLLIVKEADRIVVEEVKMAGIYNDIWQVFSVLLDSKSVGVKGDKRSYEKTIVIRAVESVDGMTADWVKFPYSILEKISNRITNEVRGINRVVYDITSKPPSTIEWE